MDLGRYTESHSEEGTSLPKEWTESFVGLLTQTYFEKTEKDHRFFDVYGQIFEKEFVVVISYIHHDDHHAAPISIFISHDVDDDKKMKKGLDKVINLAGHILDDIFSVSDWSDFIPTWTENTLGENQFFYKITRENIGLTLQAEEILKNDGLI
jgi:hypothetical protein